MIDKISNIAIRFFICAVAAFVPLMIDDIMIGTYDCTKSVNAKACNDDLNEFQIVSIIFSGGILFMSFKTLLIDPFFNDKEPNKKDHVKGKGPI